MMRLTSLLVAFSLLTSAATAYAECSWRVRWPNDDRMWAVPWGTVPRGSFVTRTACERAIENMLQEAIRAQALLIEAPACVCVPGRDDLARSLLLGPRWLARDDYQRLDRVGARRELAGDAVEYPAVMGANFNPRGARSLVNNG